MNKSKYSHISFWKGKKLSDEHRKKLSLAKIGKVGIGMTGRKHTASTKDKMSLKKMGHIPWNKGLIDCYTTEMKERMRLSRVGIKILSTRDEKHHNWKGENATLCAIHIWVRRRKPKITLCEICNTKPAVDLANVSQKYKRNVNDYLWLCRKCHMVQDGRIKN